LRAPFPFPMDETELSAQERLERQALVNVRNLVARLEDEEKRRKYPVLPVFVFVGVVMALAIAIALYLRPRPYTPPSKPTVAMTEAEFSAHVVDRIMAISNERKRRDKRGEAGGSVVVSIRVDDRGMAQATIEQSSLDSVFDNEMRSEVASANPFGRPAPGTQPIKVRITVDHKILVATKIP